MKVVLIVAALLTCIAAWSKEDHEIFQLNDAVQTDLGSNVTFYSWIGITQSATQKELNSAYRKRSAELHPDKAKARFVKKYKKEHDGKAPTQRQIKTHYKDAEARFKRLSVVGSVLRGEGRDRYDYFLKNGFPKWRGTGYYYSRYRPGAFTVVLGLIVFILGVAHYGALLLGYKRHREFVDRYIKHARKMAWGDSMGIAGVPLGGSSNGATGFESTSQGQQEESQAQNWNRKQRRLQEKENKKAGKNSKAAKAARESGISTPVDAELTSGPIGAKKRVVAENGKVLIVDSVGNVYIEEQTEEGDTIELLLDIDAIEPPTIYDTVLFKLPAFVYRKTLGKYINPHQAVVDELESDEPDTLEDAALDSATSVNAVEESERRKPKVRRR